MENIMPPERARAILNLRFGDKLKIALLMTRKRFLGYFASILLLGIALWFAWAVTVFLMAFLIGFILVIPLLFATIFVIIGFHASILRYMDGIECNIAAHTFVEPCSRWLSLAVPVLVVIILLCLCELVAQMFLLIPFIGILMYTCLCPLLSMVQTCYLFYWAENRQANMEEHISNPLKLLFGNFGAWLSAFLLGLLGYVPGLICFAVYIAASILLLGYSASSWTGPEFLFQGGFGLLQIAGIVVIGVVFFAGFIFSTFVYAIAYKQSMAARQLSGTYSPPPPVFY